MTSALARTEAFLLGDPDPSQPWYDDGGIWLYGGGMGLLGAFLGWSLPVLHILHGVRNCCCGKQTERVVESHWGRTFLFCWALPLWSWWAYAIATGRSVLGRNDRYIHDPETRAWVSLGGALLCFLMTLFLLWIHCHLGRNWTRDVRLLEDHQLVTSGPYRCARHPMYSCFALWWIGMLLKEQLDPYLAAYVSLFFLYVFSRIGIEERTMLHEFGEEYLDFKQRRGAFLPCTGCDCGVSMEEARQIVRQEEAYLPPPGEDEAYM
jgi:protein-S-isoprenylcysteine O-methyltransferase Ste14